MALNKEQHLPGRTFPEYFTELSANYARATGNSTYKLISEYLRTAPPIVDTDSIVNDNACGPGIATAAIIEHLGGREPKLIVANDSVPAMVNALQHRITTLGWRNVQAVEMDSHELDFPNDTFTLSISNISVSTYKDPVKCLGEMLRTLKPGGLAIVTIWKRFAAAELIHAAQQLVKPHSEAELMQIPKAEFMQQGYLQQMMSEVGFQDVKTETVSVLCKDGEIEGLKGFMLGDFTRAVRAPWTEAEKEMWPAAVASAVEEEVARYGGVWFEAWVSSGRK